MILLLGGTSDAAELARVLAHAGHEILVSKATGVALYSAPHPRIETREGPLDEASLRRLIEKRAIRAIVDATHPYAQTIRAIAAAAAERAQIPYLSFVRPAAIERDEPGITWAADHAAAARLAFGYGRPVLLTTGTRHLAPYVDESRRTRLALVARVLDEPTSLAACLAAGIAPQQILAARGPFSVEANRQHLREYAIGALVTKDSGTAGGTREKLEAARAEGCRVVAVARPPLQGPAFHSAAALSDALGRAGR